MDRPELTRCIDTLRKGDTLVIWKLDRLGRSLRDLLEIVERLESTGVQFISLTEDINTKAASGRFIFHVFAVLAEFERNLIRERTKAGLATARGVASAELRKRHQKDRMRPCELCGSAAISLQPSWPNNTGSPCRPSGAEFA